MTRILLVRHCEAQGNTDSVFQGHTDCEISGSGETQLELLALRCRNMPINAIYSSPLRRARLTAEAVNRYHHLEIRTDPRLIEINGGVWEGKPWCDLPALYPEQTEAWYKRPHEFAPENGESMREIYGRIWKGITDIVRENPDKTVCIASHGCAIRNFLCRAQGWPIERLNDVDWCDNTALSIIEFDGDLNSKVVLMNDASHLTPETSVFMHQTWWQKEEA
jgi:Fructose-2,6-bisphosphatase